MLLPQRKDQLRTFSVKADGSISEGETIPLRNTLFSHAFGMEDASLLRLEVPEEGGFDGMAGRLRLANALQRGIRGQQVLGSGHGVKDGKLYSATPEVVAKVHSFFRTAEDALAYGGLLFSEATHVLKLSSAKLTTKGLGDGQGWIDSKVLVEHGLPVRQVQVRALWPKAIAKGTLLPVEGLREKEGVEVLFHDTQVKSMGKDLSGEFLLAIRDTAQVRSMRSSWTFTQFLDEDLQEKLFERYARPSLLTVRRAMESNDSALAFLDGIQLESEEEKEMRDLLTSYLSAGLSPRHPWVHRKMQELVRRTYLDAALGLGPVPLTSEMVAYIEDDRCRHHITCPSVPEGQYAILRYPVRDTDSVRLVQNIHMPGIPEGSIAVHPELIQTLDGDYDGDWVAISADRDLMRGVARMHKRGAPRLPIPPRTRKRSPLSALPRVAVDAIGASGIGTPTWLVAACVDKKRLDLVPGLSLQLQLGTMGLKWSVHRDYDFMKEVGRKVKLPEWIELAKDPKVFVERAERVPDVGLGRFWNLAVEAFEEDTLGTRGDLGEFTDLVPLPRGDADILAETETMRQGFNRRVADSKGRDEEIRASLRTIRDWGAGKAGEDRVEFARTAWYLSHRTKSIKSTASFAIHAFPDSLVKDIQTTSGYRTPVLGSFHGNRIEVIEGKAIRRSERPVQAPVKGNGTETSLVRLVGGHRALEAMYEVGEAEAMVYLEQLVADAGHEPAEVNFHWVNAPWNGHRVLRADLNHDPLGYLPEEVAETKGEEMVGRKKATLLVRGKSVYAVIQ